MELMLIFTALAFSFYFYYLYRTHVRLRDKMRKVLEDDKS